MTSNERYEIRRIITYADYVDTFTALPIPLQLSARFICDFCPSDQRFAYNFFQILPHERHPCCSATHFPLSGRVWDFHPLEFAYAGQTKGHNKSLCCSHSIMILQISHIYNTLDFTLCVSSFP